MLKNIVFETTSRCNLDCQYCYNIHKRPGMSDSAVRGSYGESCKTLSRLFALADVERIAMSGGEPFLSERFLELVLFCRMNGKKVNVITNGNSADIKAYKTLVDMGVRTFQLPLHSSIAEEHDEMSGHPGSCRKSVNSMKAIWRLGAKVVPVIVLTKINFRSLKDTLTLCAKLGLKRIMLNRVNIGGKGIERAHHLALGKNDLRSAFRKADETSARLSLKLSSNVCSPRCILDPDDYPNIAFAACSPDMSRRAVTLDPLGNLRYCNHSPIIIGNIHKQSLEDIFRSRYLETWQDARPPLCSACHNWDRCFGGCRAAAEQLGLTTHHADPILEFHP